jgi:ferric-dicitrate binding protein FerR (iron transport regulator)
MTRPDVHKPPPGETPAVSAQAAEWFVRLAREDPHAVHAQYVEWLRQSPLHVAEALRIGGVFAALRRTRLERLELDELDSSNVIELPLPR